MINGSDEQNEQASSPVGEQGSTTANIMASLSSSTRASVASAASSQKKKEISASASSGSQENLGFSASFRINYADLKRGIFIAEGSCASVYYGLLRNISTAIPVAIKEANEAGLKYLIAEAETLAFLSQSNTPGIPKFYGTFQDPSSQKYSLVMEYIPSKDLYYQLVENNLQMPAYAIAAQVTFTMKEMHARGVLHRDLKIENVLPCPGGKAIVCDFGFSVKCDANNVFPDINLCGTAKSIAPEVFERLEYSDKSDVYALGTFYFELFSENGESSPFDYLRPKKISLDDWPRYEKGAIKKAVMAGERPAIPKTYPEGIARLIKLCWAQDPKSRPTAEKAYDELQASLAMTPELTALPKP